jgi:post-segregation antitoxin (ccd killing protein)
MKNVTVTVDDDLYRRARVRAAEDGTTVSAVVKSALREYASDATVAEGRAQALRKLFERVDSRLQHGKVGDIVEAGWRDRTYDERFAETALGRSLAARRR